MRPLNDRLCRVLEALVTAGVAAAVLVVLWGVFARFVINLPSRWTEELATYLLTWVALLGAAIAFRHRQHLGVDFFYTKLDADARRLNTVVIHVFVILFALIVLIWGGATLVLKTLATGQVTAAMGIQTGYTYLAVPISGLAIVLFTLEELLQILFVTAPTSDPTTNAEQAE